MAVQSLPLNSVLNQRFTVIKVIGSGAMGVVYQVHDGQDGSILAVKELSCAANSQIDRKQYEQLFRREARILKGLSHPNLPRVIDFFEENGKLYLVMEFIDGKSLLEILENNNGPLRETAVLRWGITICEILRYLHNQYPPIIFRDLKPANVIETLQGDIKLVDFGIARYYRKGQCTDTVALGSPGYAAPEQYYGKGQSDPRTDIYGLGATLHVLLTDRDPLDTPFSFPEVSSINHAVSMKTSKIIAQATMTDPLFRFYSAADMLYSLRASFRGLTAGAFTPSVTASGYAAGVAPVPAAPVPRSPAPVPPPPSTAQVWHSRLAALFKNPLQLLALRKSNFGRAAAAFLTALVFFLPLAIWLCAGVRGDFGTTAFYVLLVCFFFGFCGFFTT